MTARHGNDGYAVRQDQTCNLFAASKALRTLIWLKTT
jgi:hypothetical protein